MKKIKPLNRVDAAVEVPGSKSITQRALITAALADGDSELIGPLASDDTRYTATALRAMGIGITEQGSSWFIAGRAGNIQTPAEPIYLGNNGTATRFLTSIAALGHGRFEITGDERMAQRPIAPLIEALAGWGVNVSSIGNTGCPPLEIKARGIAGGKTVLPEGKSSQYVSSLLLVAPYTREKAELAVKGEVLSQPYVAMTMDVMADFGIEVIADDSYTRFEIPRGRYRASRYHIEGDASSASYFWAAAAVTGGRVTVTNVPVPSMQGDAFFVAMLARMGCEVEQTGTGITVIGPGELHAVEVDMGNMPDVVPTLAVVAARARGRSVIKNIGHLRIKECDRLHVMAVELAKLGVHTEERPDSLIIEGKGGGAFWPPAEIETYNDHRIAMSFAVAGLKTEGLSIQGEECVAKSFPDFWERFQRLYPA
jgi:3-phosphoshikimate 1-carboxyvinyltransferase